MDWKKLKNAEVFGKGNYLTDGHYKVKILKMFTKTTRKKDNALIVDFEVMHSTNSKINVGQKRNWYQGLDDEDIAFPAVKEFMLALLAIDEDDDEAVKEFEDSLEELMEVCSDEKWEKKKDSEHPLHGKFIAVECFTKKTKKDNDFTVHKWSPWDGED